jgi:general stress protein 26
MITPDQNDKLWALIKGMRTGMLVTQGEFLHARPMGLLQKDFQGILWFFTDKNSPKAEEIKNNPEVCIAFGDSSADDFVSLTGYASFSDNRAKIDELWSPVAGVYFKGKDDPDLILLQIDVQRAEYWDSKSNKMVQIFEMIKAGLTGKQADLGENRKFD